ncbi:MAG: hypothetical protein QOF18_1731 [Frankiaceae bacterium]|nr:hypothetical protein [Frankiaceae bacterium]
MGFRESAQALTHGVDTLWVSVQPSSTATELSLAAAARLLAARGVSATSDVLTLMIPALGCSEAVLRAPDAARVLARAGSTWPVPAQPAGERFVLDVPVRACGELQGVLTIAGHAVFTLEQAEVLTGLADVLALAWSAQARAGRGDAGRAVLDDEADRAQAATELCDNVGEALVTVRYAADLVAAGRAGADALDEPVQAAQAALRDAHRALRAYALEAGLRTALREIAARGGADRPADGRPALDLTVDADDPWLDALPPPVAVTVQRVAEAALRCATGVARLTATFDGQRVKLCVESAEIAYDASELDRWARRASALGGDLRLRPAGVELELPAQTASPPAR